MPQPIKDQQFSASYHPSKVAERPLLAIKLSVAVNAWNGVEEALGAVMAAILSPKGSLHHAPGHAIVNSFFNVSSKVDAIRAAAKHSLTKKQNTELEEMLGRVRKRAVERNRVVHAQLGISTKYPDHLIVIPRLDSVARPIKYSEKDFDDIVTRCLGLTDDLMNFAKSLQGKK